MSATSWALTLLWLAALALAAWWGHEAWLARRIRQRLGESASGPPQTQRPVWERFLDYSLQSAGIRRSGAARSFALVALAALAAGGLVVWVSQGSLLLRKVRFGLADLPAGFGDVLIPLTWLVPWVLGGMVAALPWMVLSDRRKRRQQAIAADFPLALDLLAALTQAGLAFDAAVDRVVRDGLRDGPLRQEFHGFQRDLQAGEDRVTAFRRLARRIDVPAVTTFVSAVVQAEQAGASLSPVLRRQAEDFRRERRERALEQAMAMPVKRLLPLVLCFLPALFVVMLGPIFYEILQLLDLLAGVR
ncbi:MAG: type II secretion system F family protein [Sumerlaeia bacterium]